MEELWTGGEVETLNGGLGCGQGVWEREFPIDSPASFPALWPHMVFGGQ